MDDMLFCIISNLHVVTISTHAIKRHFLIWMTTMKQPTKRRCSCVLTLKCTFICGYWWTRQRIHNTLIVVDWYLQLMGDKTIPDSAEPRLKSFYPPFVTRIDLPHQGVVDSYNLIPYHRSLHLCFSNDHLTSHRHPRWPNHSQIWDHHSSVLVIFPLSYHHLLSPTS